MSTMLENASEVLFVLGILFTVAGVIFREIRRAKDPYKGRAVATVVELAPGKPDRAGKEAGVHDYYYPVMTFYASNGRLIRSATVRAAIRRPSGWAKKCLSAMMRKSPNASR